jgi:hypothetical protein
MTEAMRSSNRRLLHIGNLYQRLPLLSRIRLCEVLVKYDRRTAFHAWDGRSLGLSWSHSTRYRTPDQSPSR